MLGEGLPLLAVSIQPLELLLRLDRPRPKQIPLPMVAQAIFGFGFGYSEFKTFGGRRWRGWSSTCHEIRLQLAGTVAGTAVKSPLTDKAGFERRANNVAVYVWP